MSVEPPFLLRPSGSTLPLAVRRATPKDLPAQRVFVQGLSRQTRYLRFLTGGPVLDDVATAIVFAPSGLVAAMGERGDGAIVANAHYVVDAKGQAEIAVVVGDAWQGRGIGRHLLRALVQRARAEGVVRLVGEVLSENRRMLALARDQGFTIARNPADAQLHALRLELADGSRWPNRGGGQVDRLPLDWFEMR